MRCRRFKHPALARMYDGGSTATAFRRGYLGYPSSCVIPGSLAYAAWAAGRDRSTADKIPAHDPGGKL